MLAPVAGANPGATSVGPDVKPEIPASVYAARRAKLMQSLGGCAAVLKSFTTSSKTDPYFYYLTGLTEAGAMLVLSPRSRVFKQELQLPARNPGAEIWTGYKEPISAKLSRKYKVDRVGVARGISRTLRRALRRSRCYRRTASRVGSARRRSGR